MIDSILVPTDGSILSERALPVALEIAEAQGATVHLVQGVEHLPWIEAGPEGFLYAPAYQQIMDALDAQAEQNLDGLAARASERGIPVTTAVFHGSAGAGLLEYEEELQPDVVVMATHGRTGLSRFARGSVADLILREGSAPVLLVRPFGPEPTRIRRAVVALDGSSLAERALPIVAALAQRPIQDVSLVVAVPDLEQRLVEAAYLSGVANRLEATGIGVTLDLPVAAPADAIAARAAEADLVIMATHGRGGLDRLRHGSVAEQVLREVTKPVLLVRVSVPRAAEEPVPVRRGLKPVAV